MVRRRLAVALTLAFAVAAPGAAQYEAVDAIVRGGVTRGVYPGAVVVIGTRDRILHARGYGHFTWNATSAIPSADSTLWDIASLTKVVATTGAAALLVDRGRLQLDAPVSRYLPRFSGGEKARVTVRMLLDHTSGLPAGVDPAARPRDREAMLDLIYATPLRRPPGASAQYSDVNAILLGLVVEGISGVGLDSFATRELFGPLRMAETRFVPPRTLRPRIAPTGQWRGTPLAGEVNDATSGRMGGIAGHAGVFATGEDLARYAQWWLRRGTPLLRPATMDTFLLPGSRSGARLLGWESRSATDYTPSPYGTLPSAHAYGHTGYTGTMFWLDPERDLFVVFLTNRSFGPRVAKPFQALHEVRARLADAAVRAVPGACRAGVTPAC